MDSKVAFPDEGMRTPSARILEFEGSWTVSCSGSSGSVLIGEFEGLGSSLVITVTEAPDSSAALKTKRKLAGSTEMYCDRV